MIGFHLTARRSDVFFSSHQVIGLGLGITCSHYLSQNELG